MNDLTQKILNILEEDNISRENMLDTIELIYKELEANLWENVKISEEVLYTLKDIIWYNLEHLPNNGEAFGVSNLRHLGTKYPNFIYCFDGKTTIKQSELPEFIDELNQIIKLWSKDWKFVTLYTKTNEGWNGGENPSTVIIFNAKSESPTKYGYNTNYGSILDANGHPMKKYDINTVLCSVETSVGEYNANSQILYTALLQLRNACQRAIQNNRDVRMQF